MAKKIIMKTKTIIEAVTEVLKKNNSGLSAWEITDAIIEQKLYSFNSTNPTSIVNSTIRKSCVGIDLKLSKKEKVFKLNAEGKYKLKGV